MISSRGCTTSSSAASAAQRRIERVNEVSGGQVMYLRRISSLLGGALLWTGLAGCGSTCNSRCGYQTTPRPAVTPSCDRCAVGGPQPPRFNPIQPPAAPSPAPPAVVPPPPAGEIQQNSYVPSGPTNAAVPPGGAPGVYLAPPEPINPATPQPAPVEAGPLLVMRRAFILRKPPSRPPRLRRKAVVRPAPPCRWTSHSSPS